MLTFNNVAKNIKDTTIFPTFDLVLKQGEIISLYANVNIRKYLFQLLTVKDVPSNGEIYLHDTLLTKENKHAIYIYYLQDVLYENLTVKEMVEFINRMQRETKHTDSLLSFVSLNELKHTRVHQLTFSERKRLQLACLLLQEADVFIFEEPDQNVDVETKQIVMKVFQQLADDGKSICLLTTNMESALSFSDKVFRLDEFGLHEIEFKHDEITMQDAKNVVPITLEKIPSKIDDKIVLFDPFEIDYIESFEGVSYLYINDDKFPSVSTLHELEAKLIPFGFFRCHRSYIVNLQKVREVITWTRNSYSLVLDNKKRTTIPLSKSKMAILKEMLGM